MARGFDRGHYTDRTSRQLWAIGDSGSRVELLKTIKVIHRYEDNLISPEEGQHTAELVQGSRFVLLLGIGHFIDKVNERKLLAEMTAFLKIASIDAPSVEAEFMARR